ncbi:MAG: envelope stress response membrane protein PspC, partial [Sphingomonadales bacterium]
RIVAVLALIFFHAPIFFGYLILGFVLKDKPRDLYEEPHEEVFWRDVRTNPAGTARDLRHRFRELERRLRAAEAYVTSAQFQLRREIDQL